MGMKQVSAEYLSVGANRQTSVADWSANGLLAFGADVNIALWRPTSCPPKGVENLLRGHREPVKAVLFLPQNGGDQASYIVSGSDDKTLIVWKSNDEERRHFEAVQTSSEHTAPVNCVTAVRVADQPAAKWIIATGAADATIRIWSLENDQLQLLQSVQTTPKFFPLTLSLSTIDSHVLILAVAGTRETVQIYTADSTKSDINFTVQAVLQGHEGWVRSLSFTRETASEDSDLLLASASQDKYIRIWRIHRGTELPAPAASGSDALGGAFLPGRSPSNKAHRLKAGGKDYSITFEALLLGHEDWIYSARWHTNAQGKPQLLSTSADNSLAIWEADPTSGIWVSMVRLGEISREKGATTATGSTGGFWTGLWSPDGTSVACLGRTGSWRRWEYDQETDSWRPCVAITGHTKAVTGVTWSKSGSYLLSTSLDQTSRLHTEWTAGSDVAAGTWHEMSRPQIHGYDLNCIDTLDDTQFVSGADEKLMRVFSKPKAVATLLNRLAGHSHGDVHNMPHAANMPVLGLSNKAIDAVEDDQEIQPIDDRDRDAVDPASIVKRSYLEINHPPLEETLSRHTLWPEAEKLYGHGYEISCLAASHDGKLVASACKASSTNHAVIRLFETDKWTEIRPPLVAHSLTTTRLRFSGDDQYLLSVGRDRQWAVFEKDSSNEAMYKLLQSNLKGHSRMILDAAWAPSSRPLFATAGRDKQVRIWSAEASESGQLHFSQSAALSCSGSVTAVDFLPVDVNGSFVLAVGTETGRLSICLLDAQGIEMNELTPHAEFSLPKAVLQLAWRPTKAASSTSYTLAVAGEDSSLRVFSFDETYLRTQ